MHWKCYLRQDDSIDIDLQAVIVQKVDRTK